MLKWLHLNFDGIIHLAFRLKIQCTRTWRITGGGGTERGGGERVELGICCYSNKQYCLTFDNHGGIRPTESISGWQHLRWSSAASLELDSSFEGFHCVDYNYKSKLGCCRILLYHAVLTVVVNATHWMESVHKWED